MNIDRRTLPLTALRAFEAFGRHGTMSAAAAALGVTHSAVSRQIAQLEQILGHALTEGPRSNTRMNAKGTALLPSLTQAFDQMESSLAAIAPPSNVVDVSCVSTLALRWLIPDLFGFQTLHPDVRVRLTSDDGPVDDGPNGPDIALRVGRAPWPASRHATPLMPDRTGPVLIPQLVPSYPEDILQMQRLSTATRPDAWADWAQLTGHSLHPAPTTEFEHFHVAIEAALAGLGVVLVPDVLVRAEVQAGRLVAPFGFATTGLHYTALSRPAPSPAAARLLAWITRGKP